MVFIVHWVALLLSFFSEGGVELKRGASEQGRAPWHASMVSRSDDVFASFARSGVLLRHIGQRTKCLQTGFRKKMKSR